MFKKVLPLLATSIIFFIPSEKIFAAETNETILNYLEGEDYIFAAERIPTNRWDTPANVHVITAQEIEENHYQSVEEALSHVNGLVVFNFGVQGSRVVMNGDERILLLIDGRRANNSQTAVFAQEKSDLTMIPSMKIIERIEIIKGGFSALYGTDALGGIINIITKKGSRDETTFDINFGSWNKQNYEITNQGSKKNFSWFIAGNFGKSNSYNYKGSADNFSEHSDFSDKNFSIRLDNRFSEKNSITLAATHKSHKWYDKNADGLYNNFYISYNFKEGTTTPSWLRYFNNYKSTWFRFVENPYMKIQGIEYQNGWELGRHKIIFGLEYHKNSATDSANGYENKKINNKAFYLQDTIKIGEKWNFVPGTRFDHSDQFGNNFSPKISANYRPEKNTKFYASWGKIYRTPSIAEMYIVDTTANYYGNDYVLKNGGEKKLKSEKGHTETIGMEHNFDENSSVAINFFNSRVNDDIFWTRKLTPFYNSKNEFSYWEETHIPTNSDFQKRRGGEISFAQKINYHFSYNLAYSHTKTDSKLSGSYFYQPNGYRVGFHYNNKNLRINFLSAMVSGRSEGTKDFEGYPSKNYAVFDLNASYDINEHSQIYLKALNFTNQNYSNLTKGYHSPGKFFLAGATVRF